MEINDLKRTTSVKLAKISSVFIAKRTIKKYRTAPQKQILRETFFGMVVRTAFYLYGETFWEKKVSEPISACRLFSEFEGKLFDKVVKTAFYLSRGTFWSIFVKKKL